MKIENKTIIASILFLLLSFLSEAQGKTPPPGAPPLPIDGGVLTGIVIALFYGAKKLYNRDK